MRNFTVAITEDLFAQIEDARGEQSRNAFVREAITAWLTGDPHPTKKMPPLSIPYDKDTFERPEAPPMPRPRNPRDALLQACAQGDHKLNWDPIRGENRCLCGEVTDA